MRWCSTDGDWGEDDSGKASPPRERFERLGAGGRTTGASTVDTIACWGDLGEAPPLRHVAEAVSAAGDITCLLHQDGRVSCFGRSSTGAASPPSLDSVVSISAGSNHSCGLLWSGEVVCWGDDSFGQSTPPDGAFAAVVAGGWHTCGLVDEGGSPDDGYEARCWGLDTYGQVSGVPPYLFLELHLGEEHSCGLKTDGLLACWGRNLEGQLDGPLPDEL